MTVTQQFFFQNLKNSYFSPRLKGIKKKKSFRGNKLISLLYSLTLGTKYGFQYLAARN